MTVDGIGTVCFVGAGTMGCANSLVAAVSGYDVVITDALPESLDAVESRHAEIGAFLVGAGYCDESALAAGLGRISLEADLAAACRAADLVSESIFENADAKRDLFARIDEVAGPDTIVTTNTSTLMVSELEGVLQRGDKFAALHSHLGALLFDIVGGPRTSPETVETLRKYVLSLGGVPLVLEKEHPGYVFNAMNGALLTMALRLVLDDHATIEEVDQAWMSTRSAPMGPFGMMDLFGLDLILDTWRRPRDDPRRQALAAKVVPFLSGHVDDGRLGLKSGSGFYRYPEPAYQAPGFVAAASASSIAADALHSALIQSALEVVGHDVATTEDVDMAWTVATGLDTGPFGMLEQLGTGRFLDQLRRLVDAGVMAPESTAVVEARLAETN